MKIPHISIFAASVAGENPSRITNHYVDIGSLEKEYVLASAQYLLAQGKDTSTFAGMVAC